MHEQAAYTKDCAGGLGALDGISKHAGRKSLRLPPNEHR